MEKIVTRFGEVDYDPKSILHFPAGLIGFPNLRQFVVMPNKKDGPLFWIQSIDDPSFALVLTDPTNFFLDYFVAPDGVERQHLHIGEDDACFVLTVVTVPPNQEISLNLAAPILFSPKSNRAMQVILEDAKYNSKTPLPQPKIADKVVDKVANGG
jgi:flagellar assembly factor FliW